MVSRLLANCSLLLMLASSATPGAVQAGTQPTQGPIPAFWSWFNANEERLFGVDQDSHDVFDEIAAHLQAVHPDVTFEIGPVQDGKREFVISANGFKEAFHAVEAIHAAAPALSRWVWIKFRPRREAMDVEIQGIQVKAADVKASLQWQPGAAKPDLVLVLLGFNERNEDLLRMFGFLFLDQALGEYDVEMRVGGIEMITHSPQGLKLCSLAELPTEFDALWSRGARKDR